jgi:hypothetical protein
MQNAAPKVFCMPPEGAIKYYATKTRKVGTDYNKQMKNI